MPNKKRFRIALCLYGYYNNSEDALSGMNGYTYIDKHILSREDVDVDVFFHSWEPNKESTLVSQYKPILHVSEPQIDFAPMINDRCENVLHYHQAAAVHGRRPLGTFYSFLYTRKRALELKKDYEAREDFTYDCVITSRFDLGQRDKFGGWYVPPGHPVYYVSRINFDPSFDMNHVYSAMWDQLNCGYADQWFYSSSKNMNKFIDFYENAYGYLDLGSEYENAMLKGWPDSVFYDHKRSDDLRLFTNEMLKL